MTPATLHRAVPCDTAAKRPSSAEQAPSRECPAAVHPIPEAGRPAPMPAGGGPTSCDASGRTDRTAATDTGSAAHPAPADTPRTPATKRSARPADPATARIAFCIECHRHTPVLEALIEALEHPCHEIFIHVDGKTPLSAFAPLQGRVRFVTPRSKVYWGDFAQIACMLTLLRAVRAAEKTGGGNLPIRFFSRATRCRSIPSTRCAGGCWRAIPTNCSRAWRRGSTSAK